MISADKVVKVGDLGMARNVYMTDFYHTSSNVGLPIRWMAPESINPGLFSSKSDVWSYGIVLWEIATLADFPYDEIRDENIEKAVKNGKRLVLPVNCPTRFQSLTTRCWEEKSKTRPTFFDVCK